MTARNHIKYIAATACFLMFACGNTGSKKITGQAAEMDASPQGSSIIASVSPVYGSSVKQGSEVNIDFMFSTGKSADSVVLFVGGRRMGTIDEGGFRYNIPADHPTGRVQYRITAYSGGTEYSRSGEFTVTAAKEPKAYGYRVVNTYDHARDAYTQGLLWHDGHLYESTGLTGGSSLRKTELSGKVLENISLDRQYFAEGLALLGGRLFQLTWMNNKAFVYDLETLKPIKEFGYSGQGWGLTEDGTYLYMSDGSEKIYVLDPETFKRLRTIEVYTNNRKVDNINEMEWINGEIWANIYMSDIIARIDPETGAVKGLINLAGLLPASDRTPQTDVLNGIAFDRAGNRIFVTGKNWPKLFQIEVFEK